MITPPSRRHHFPWLSLGAGFTLLCLSLYLIFQVLSGLKQPALAPFQDLLVQKNGRVYQESTQVGTFRSVGEKQEARLRVSDEVNYQLRSVDLSIILPKPIKAQDLTLSISSVQGTDGMAAFQTDPTTLRATFDDVLPESYTTLILQVPAGYFALPLFDLLPNFLLSISFISWILLSLLLVLGVLLYSLIITHQGQFPKPFARRISSPEKLTALEMDILLHGKLRSKSISTLVYELANRGYLEIIQNEDKIFFARKAKISTSSLHYHEQMILNLITPPGTQPKNIQEILYSITEELFSTVVSNVYIEIYNGLTAKGYFKNNLRFTHLQFKTLGIIIQLISLIFVIFSYAFLNFILPGLIILGVAGYLVGLIVYQTGYSIVKLTDWGRQTTQESLAFGQYLEDPASIGPAGRQGYLFFHYLPFALVLNKEQAWLERFQHVDFYIPSWFTSSKQEFFEPIIFLDQVKAVTDVFAAVFVKVKDPNVD